MVKKGKPVSHMSFNDEINKLRFPIAPIKLTNGAKADIAILRKAFNELAHLINTTTDVNRAHMLAFTALQEARMWSIQAVIDTQITNPEFTEDAPG